MMAENVTTIIQQIVCSCDMPLSSVSAKWNRKLLDLDNLLSAAWNLYVFNCQSNYGNFCSSSVCYVVRNYKRLPLFLFKSENVFVLLKTRFSYIFEIQVWNQNIFKKFSC